jgi:hypothetical protein
LLLGALLPVVGAAVAALAIVASSRPVERILREPIELHPAGDFTHPAGFVMPLKAGPFERDRVVQYDESGRNLSAGYNALVGDETPLPIVATLYVYPVLPGEDLDAKFGEVAGEVERRHGAPSEFRQNILLGPSMFEGRYAGFGYKEPWGGVTEDVPLHSYLVLYRWNGWWVKWRATTPAPVSPERMKAIVALTESLLPPGAQPEPEDPPRTDPEAERLARQRDSACAASAATFEETGPTDNG